MTNGKEKPIRPESPPFTGPGPGGLALDPDLELDLSLALARARAAVGPADHAPPTADRPRRARHTSRRRRRIRFARGAPMSLNLVAMIDVVFLLLMYFLLTMNFSLGEELYQLDLPAPFGARDVDPFDLPEHPIIVTVSTTGPTSADYRLRVDVGDTRPPTYEALYRFLFDNRVRPDNPGGLFMPDTPILIQPAPGTRWDQAVNVLNACLRANYTVIRFIEPV